MLGDQLVTCHVGDVRAYLRTSQGIEQITRDHTIVGALVETGEITPDEARVHPAKNAVLQAIGLPEGFVPEVNSRSLKDGYKAFSGKVRQKRNALIREGITSAS